MKRLTRPMDVQQASSDFARAVARQRAAETLSTPMPPLIERGPLSDREIVARMQRKITAEEIVARLLSALDAEIAQAEMRLRALDRAPRLAAASDAEGRFRDVMLRLCRIAQGERP